MFRRQPPQVRRRDVERFVPPNPDPARIRIALWTRPLQRVAQPIGMINQFRRGSPFAAKRLAGRVRWVRFKRNETAVLDSRNGAAAGDAECAIAMNLLD